MCGRYVLFTDEEEDDIADFVREIQERLSAEGDDGETDLRVNGEVFPSQKAPVLVKEGTKAMRWGLPGFKGKGLIINARAESVYGKVMFRQSITNRRAVILSHGFFEWRKDGASGQKEKLLFNLPKARGMYLAGLYNDYEDCSRFAIITTSANESMSSIHNRMPVILKSSEVEDYLANERIACGILGRTPPLLEYRSA